MDPYENPSPFTPAQLAACCRREEGKRIGFYPKLVAMHKMSQEAADLEIQKMAAAAAHFEALTPPVPVVWATAGQRTEIERLVKNPLITRPERTKVLIRINTLDADKATRLIAKLTKAIDERENGPGEAQQDLSQLPWLQTA